MSDRDKSARDAFGFGLKGLRAAASYAAVIPVADDGINEAWDKRLGGDDDRRPGGPGRDRVRFGRHWLLRRVRASQ